MAETFIRDIDRISLDRPSVTVTGDGRMLTVGAAFLRDDREVDSFGLTMRPELVAEVGMRWVAAALGAGWRPSDPEDVAALGHALVEAAHSVMAEAHGQRSRQAR